jgi:signal peptidase
MSTKKRTIGSVIGGTLLNLAAAGGVVCIIAVIAAFAFNITLIMFKTGSMSPTIPAGSLAVVRQIPASEIRVGDVVTVDRAGKPPITHRVRAISSVSSIGGELRSITMRGDANTSDDPQSYSVGHVRIVLLSVPGLAYAVVAVSHPLALAGITLGAAALVFWTFWPHARGRHRRTAPVRATARTSGIARGVLPLAVLPLVLAFMLGAPDAAQATETESVVHGRYLTLTSIGDPDVMEHLVPGRPVQWQVGVQAHPPETSSISIGISAQGGLAGPGGLQVDIRACTVRWVNGRCTGKESAWLSHQDLATAVVPVDAHGAHKLGAMPSTEQRWLLVQTTMPVGTPAGSTAQMRIHAWGSGDDIGIGSGPLPVTGLSIGPWIMFGVISVVSGVGLVELARRRGRAR